MKILDNHWLEGANIIESPFFDQRVNDADVSLLVVHNISLPPGQFGGPYIEQLFTGNLDPNAHPFFEQIHTLRVSAHCLIRRNGEVVQFVPFNARAWHAGVSQFAGRKNCNDYSIGIEMEGTDFTGYTEEQYHSLSQLTMCAMKKYPQITKQRITGHQYIAPGRKTDPGLSFDWSKFFASIS